MLATVLLIAALIGANFSALKFALEHSTPFFVAGMRTIIGGSFLLVLATLRGERLPTNRRDLLNIFAVSFSITTVSSALLVFGVNRVPAGLGSLVASTMPLFTALLTLLLLSVAPTRMGKVGLGIGFVGTAILASPSLGGETTAVGVITLVLSAIAWAFGTVYLKWKDFSRVSPIMLVGVQLIMSAVVLIPFCLLYTSPSPRD